MKLICEGLVIWQTKSGEASRVVTLLTPDGLVVAFAKNSLKPKNKLASATSILAYSDFELFSGRNMYDIDEAVCKNRFVALSADIEGLALAMYLCEVMKEIAPVNDDAVEYLSLMLNSLYLINEGEKPPKLIKAVFELAALSLAGYMPDLSACEECGATDERGVFFDIDGGGCLCESCAAKRGIGINCAPSVVMAMRHILYGDTKKAFSFSLSEQALDNLASLSERYLLARLEFMPKTLEYYKKIHDDN